MGKSLDWKTGKKSWPDILFGLSMLCMGGLGLERGWNGDTAWLFLAFNCFECFVGALFLMPGGLKFPQSRGTKGADSPDSTPPEDDQ